jgi:ribonuclease P protein component
MAPDTLKIERMRTRPQFLAAAKARACPRGAVLAQGRDRRDGDPTIHIGFTATKKLGGAMVRNRAKRRLREAARQMAPLHARPGCDYVFIARGGVTTRSWPRLLDDMKSALISLAADLAAPGFTSEAVPPAG